MSDTLFEPRSVRRDELAPGSLFTHKAWLRSGEPPARVYMALSKGFNATLTCCSVGLPCICVHAERSTLGFVVLETNIDEAPGAFRCIPCAAAIVGEDDPAQARLLETGRLACCDELGEVLVATPFRAGYQDVVSTMIVMANGHGDPVLVTTSCVLTPLRAEFSIEGE